MLTQTKKCSKCKKIKEAFEFNKCTRLKSGLRPACKKCESKQKTVWYQKHKKEERLRERKRYKENRSILRKLKINGCAICGYNKCCACLEFHHVNPQDKCFNINAQYLDNKNLVDELNKCMLLCNRCHGEIHHKEI